MSAPVYLIDGARTPFLKARGKPGPFTPVDLAVNCGRPLLAKLNLPNDAFDDVILGCVNPVADEVNPGRVAALRLGLDMKVPGWTVQRNCGSGMQSIDVGFREIADGRAHLVLAGGTESLSHTPLLFPRSFVEWFGRLASARDVGAKLQALLAFRPAMLKPVIGLERGLTDPVVELNMGQTAEVLAYLFSISRESADAYAVESHHRLANAHNAGFLDEIEPMYDKRGKLYDHDDGVRPESTQDSLAKLKPAFEKPFGKVTPGNSSQITDGACWVVLASEEARRRYNLTPLARIVDSHWAALDPRVMGLGPTLAATPLLIKYNLGLADIHLWEINEAFAAQVIACLKAFVSEAYCRQYLGLDSALGLISTDKLNVDGGAIAIGHPVGCSGARIVLHLAKAMQRLGKKRGMASECIGGGQGGAMLLEAL